MKNSQFRVGVRFRFNVNIDKFRFGFEVNSEEELKEFRFGFEEELKEFGFKVNWNEEELKGFGVVLNVKEFGFEVIDNKDFFWIFKKLKFFFKKYWKIKGNNNELTFS